MAQERVDDFFQMAKYYAKAEKDLGVQRWVFIGFERKDGYNYIRLFSYDLPREVFERRRWVIEWRKARLVCQYPKDNVRYTLHFYDKRLGLDVRLNEDLNKHIIKSLDSYFGNTSDEHITDDISQEGYVTSTGEDYPILKVNDLSDDNAMLEFAVIGLECDILKLSFLGRIKG